MSYSRWPNDGLTRLASMTEIVGQAHFPGPGLDCSLPSLGSEATVRHPAEAIVKATGLAGCGSGPRRGHHSPEGGENHNMLSGLYLRLTARFALQLERGE